MRTALSLARRGLGRVWPNPAVGCVLVRDDRVVGRGWTQPGGRPHAETEALRRARDAAKGATAYVTLEPCAHYGQTGPCAEALIDAGVSRVVIALDDPDPRVDGGGIEMLREAGIEVATGLCADEAEVLNLGFLTRIRLGRPMVTFKTATTLDGRIASATGASQWITGDAARAAGHRLRAEHDAILVGAGTAIADDPSLTCRLPGMADRSPVRVLADGNLRVPATQKLIAEATQVPTWVLAFADAPADRRNAVEASGARLIDVPKNDAGGIDLAAALAALGELGVTRLMVEGGGALAASLFAADLVDRIVWYRAASIIGGDGLAAIGGFGVGPLDGMPRFGRLSVRALGGEIEERYVRLGTNEE